MEKSIVGQIAALDGMDMDGLRQKWEALFEMPPPYSSNRKQMVARLAYRIQELTYGGLSTRTRKRLDEIAEAGEGNGGRKSRNDPNHPVPGTRLIREWQGVRYEATVLEKGFEYAGRRYRSLSAIATAITGTKWNGPEFFGLRQSRKGAVNGE